MGRTVGLDITPDGAQSVVPVSPKAQSVAVVSSENLLQNLGFNETLEGVLDDGRYAYLVRVKIPEGKTIKIDAKKPSVTSIRGKLIPNGPSTLINARTFDVIADDGTLIPAMIKVSIGDNLEFYGLGGDAIFVSYMGKTIEMKPNENEIIVILKVNDDKPNKKEKSPTVDDE